MQELIYVEDEEDYSYRKSELQRRRRIMAARKARHRKKLIRFFLAWSVVLVVAGLLVFGAVKLVGAVVSLINSEDTEQQVENDVITNNVSEISDITAADPSEIKDGHVSDIDEPVGGTGENSGEGNDSNTGTVTDPVVYPTVGEKGLIIVDAGHGGYDSGTNRDGVYEKDITLDMAYWLKEELEARGYGVYMTRTTDDFVGLSKRASLANEYPDALAFVSVHINAIENHSEIAGIEGWTHERAGCAELAGALSAGVAASTGARDRGVSFRKALVVCRDTTMPAAIIECGYITNDGEFAQLQTTDYQVLVARGIADGIEQFVDTYYAK